MSLAFSALIAAAAVAASAVAAPPLRVCADPNNLPYSNAAGAGFENRIAELVARDLGRRIVYEWRPQRRGFIRETLKAGRCDLMMSLNAGSELAWATDPYYR